MSENIFDRIDLFESLQELERNIEKLESIKTDLSKVKSLLAQVEADIMILDLKRA